MVLDGAVDRHENLLAVDPVRVAVSKRERKREFVAKMQKERKKIKEATAL
jgi:hypothetical protein